MASTGSGAATAVGMTWVSMVGHGVHGGRVFHAIPWPSHVIPSTAHPTPDHTPRPGGRCEESPTKINGDSSLRRGHGWAQYDSPALGTGPVWEQLSRQYGIDTAYALSFFITESTAATDPHWSGRKPDGSTTHNIGNIVCAGYPRCYGRWRDYATWEEGIADWYRLIAEEYINARGTVMVEQIVPIYAPAFENDVPRSIAGVMRRVAAWQGIPPNQ